MWQEAEKEFEKICGQSLTRGDIRSFEDVQKTIEKASYGPDAGPEDKWDKAKSVGLECLKHLKTLVDAVSQVSSLTPIPAVAVNVSSALAFVFDIPQAIKGYNDAVDQVFSEISSALTQFHIYGSMEKIYPALAKHIHPVLTSFVKLCAYVVKYRQGGRRARLVHQIKSILKDDSGLSDEMAHFKRLLQDLHGVEGTLTLVTVQGTQKGVQALKDDADRTKTLSKIRDALGVPESVKLDAKTTQTLTNIVNGCVDHTGAWIWTDKTYLAWTAATKEKDASPSASHILLASGPSSSGKTFATALITRRLEDHKGNDRIYVAHYFFSANTQKSDNRNDVAHALKYMAFQIARVDATVHNALGKACDAKDASAIFRSSEQNLETLWGELKIGAPGSSAIYYLVFNGLEYLPNDQAELLLEFAFSPKLAGDRAGRVRVLLSGTDDKFVSSKVPIDSALRVRVEKNNEGDMRLVVKHALLKRGMLQDRRPGSDQEKAYNKIVEKLPKNVKGSYSLLQFGLENVMRLLSTRSAIRDLDNLLKQSMSSTETAIKALQRSLTTEEIGELNELLKWVLFSAESLTLDQLEAVMFLFSDTESFVSLRDIIKQKYTAVLKVDSGFVLSQDGVKDYLQKESSTRSSSLSSDQPTISMTIKINNVGQKLCEHFLWDLAHKSIRDEFKFNFDGSDSSNGPVIGGRRGAIRVDEFDAHHTIVQRALKFLNNPPQEETGNVGEYLLHWLPYHLDMLRQLEADGKGRLTPDEQADIGWNLYLLFRDGDAPQHHKANFSKTCWVASEMKNLQNWLVVPAVTRRMDRRWSHEVQRASTPVKGFLKELAKTVTKGLLQDRSWDINAINWLKEFVAVDTGVSEYEDVDLERLSTWCQTFLGLAETDLDSLWYERLAEACATGEIDVASSQIEVWQRALSKKDPSWLSYRGLALAHSSEGEMMEAIEQMRLALKEAEREGASPKPEAQDIIDLHFKLGAFTFQVGKLQSSADHYQKALPSRDAEQANRAQLGYIEARLGIPEAEGARETLRTTLADEGGMHRVTGILQTLATEPNHDTFMAKLFAVASSDHDLMRSIAQAMAAATITPDGTSRPIGNNQHFVEREVRGILLHDRAVAAYFYGAVAPDNNGTSESRSEASLQLWRASRSELSNVGGRNASKAQYEASAALAGHFFRDLLHGNRDHYFDELEKLATEASVNTWAPGSDAVGYLGILHRRNGDADKARAVLLPRFRYSMQVLSDDLPDNNRVGFSMLYQTLGHYRDYKNAAIALMFLGQPDLLVDALRFEDITSEAEELAIQYVTIDDEAEDPRAPYRRWVEARHDKLLDAVKSLAMETIDIAHTSVPDVSQQLSRFQAAQSHIDPWAAAAAVPKTQGMVDDADVSSHKNELEMAAVAYGVIQNRLRLWMWKSIRWWSWSCDGRAADGSRCTNKTDFAREFFHCLYCSNRDFCRECLARLRDPKAEMKITICDPQHRWLQIPPLGDKLFVGPQAKSVRVPEGMRAVDGDERILEIWYTQDSPMIGVEEWKDMLAKEWGIKREARRQLGASGIGGST
ncbi:hypothetical protein FB45DRAFT_981095 [Roridomyces roridus]|uniref:Fungal STAND N-terminal Goodbye domain-containing protein n=1 Tax=Roridomyces roridus TaxID=1738132 RepID=A0AAD7BFB7_9AGAR|nr:hypothetical protein FB45DRAFT_981095 [Roridomyces roridus]